MSAVPGAAPPVDREEDAPGAESHLRYVLRLADTSLVLGQRLSEWIGHAPELEEDQFHQPTFPCKRACHGQAKLSAGSKTDLLAGGLLHDYPESTPWRVVRLPDDSIHKPLGVCQRTLRKRAFRRPRLGRFHAHLYARRLNHQADTAEEPGRHVGCAVQARPA